MMDKVVAYKQRNFHWPKCRFCAKEMAPDVYGQIFCWCRPNVRYVINDSLSIQAFDLDQVGTSDLLEAEKVKIPFYLRVNDPPTSYEARILEALEKRGRDAKYDSEYLLAKSAMSQALSA